MIEMCITNILTLLNFRIIVLLQNVLPSVLKYLLTGIPSRNIRATSMATSQRFTEQASIYLPRVNMVETPTASLNYHEKRNFT